MIVNSSLTSKHCLPDPDSMPLPQIYSKQIKSNLLQLPPRTSLCPYHYSHRPPFPLASPPESIAPSRIYTRITQYLIGIHCTVVHLHRLNIHAPTYLHLHPPIPTAHTNYTRIPQYPLHPRIYTRILPISTAPTHLYSHSPNIHAPTPSTRPL